ncbi:hypothetical protein RRSWK_01282 [Rhodopirellula sp. SWK7]|nr:hypothetical protein RRSWK_01282 [Rhodopirellula sp. SWK7]
MRDTVLHGAIVGACLTRCRWLRICNKLPHLRIRLTDRRMLVDGP